MYIPWALRFQSRMPCINLSWSLSAHPEISLDTNPFSIGYSLIFRFTQGRRAYTARFSDMFWPRRVLARGCLLTLGKIILGSFILEKGSSYIVIEEKKTVAIVHVIKNIKSPMKLSSIEDIPVSSAPSSFTYSCLLFTEFSQIWDVQNPYLRVFIFYTKGFTLNKVSTQFLDTFLMMRMAGPFWNGLLLGYGWGFDVLWSEPTAKQFGILSHWWEDSYWKTGKWSYSRNHGWKFTLILFP